MGHPELKEFLHPVIVDVGTDESVAALAENFEIKYLKKYNVPLVGIVNNAGIGYPMPIEIADTKKCSDCFNVCNRNYSNDEGFYKIFTRKSRSYCQYWLSNRYDGYAMYGPYASSKFAGEGLSDSMRLELMKWGISVSLIVVGQIKTNMWGKLTGKNAPASTEVKKTSVEHELYGDLFREVERAVGIFQGTLSPPTVVSRAVVHAITSPYPKTRYVVAKISGIPVILLRNLVALFPDRIVDFIKLNL